MAAVVSASEPTAADLLPRAAKDDQSERRRREGFGHLGKYTLRRSYRHDFSESTLPRLCEPGQPSFRKGPLHLAILARNRRMPQHSASCGVYPAPAESFFVDRSKTQEPQSFDNAHH